MGRPKRIKEPVTFSITIEKSVEKKIIKLAKDNDKVKTEMVRDLLDTALKGESYPNELSNNDRLINLIKNYDNAFKTLDKPETVDALNEARDVFANGMTDNDWELYDELVE